jgi:hypothetical protein
MDLTRADVELHIDELVLHGFDRRDGPAIGDAARAELARLVGAAGAPDVLAARGSVELAVADAGELGPDASAELLGGRIGRAVFEGIGR